MIQDLKIRAKFGSSQKKIKECCQYFLPPVVVHCSTLFKKFKICHVLMIQNQIRTVFTQAHRMCAFFFFGDMFSIVCIGISFMDHVQSTCNNSIKKNCFLQPSHKTDQNKHLAAAIIWSSTLLIPSLLTPPSFPNLASESSSQFLCLCLVPQPSFIHFAVSKNQYMHSFHILISQLKIIFHSFSIISLC
jgi:hypothetical protein